MPWAGLQFVIVVFPDHIHLLFVMNKRLKLIILIIFTTFSSSLVEKLTPARKLVGYNSTVYKIIFI